MSDNQNQSYFEVLNPWADTDPTELRGISTRLTGFDGKTIGLLNNGKRAGAPMAQFIENALIDRYPSLKFSHYGPTGNREIKGSADWPKFEQWIKSIDAVIGVVGD